MLFSTLCCSPIGHIMDFNVISRALFPSCIYTKRNKNNNFAFFSFTARHRKSFYNNRNEIKKGKKKSNKNCLNINNNFGIIQKRHLFARLTLLFHMPFDVKKHFYYFLWWFCLNDKKRKATFCHWRIQFHKNKILRRWRN